MHRQFTGFLVIDKAEGMTSHDVVQAIRRQLRIKKVGHLGTLDPLASGVLPLALGGATRLAQFLFAGKKIYQGTIRLGFSTDTYDRLGQPTSEYRRPCFSRDLLGTVIEGMRGEQMQIPPPYSAKKVGGRRAYQLARRGLEVQIPPQRIRIEHLNAWQDTEDTIAFEVHCSPGTYVRSLAHELGKKLGCGSHLSRLRRLASGRFTLSMALELDQHLTPADCAESFLSANSMLDHIPAVRIPEEAQEHFLHGRPLRETGVAGSFSASSPLFRILSGSGHLLGLAEARAPLDSDGGLKRGAVWLYPKTVLRERASDPTEH